MDNLHISGSVAINKSIYKSVNSMFKHHKDRFDHEKGNFLIRADQNAEKLITIAFKV